MNLVNMLTGPRTSPNQPQSNVLEANTSAVLSDRAWAEEQAQKQMDFQREMSSTAWQRAIADLQKAGLNPALAYMQGGAASAAGSQASTSSTEQQTMLQMQRDQAAMNRELVRGMFRVASNVAGRTTRNTFLIQ